MASRGLGAVLGAAAYSVIHYVVVAGDLLRDFGKGPVAIPILMLFHFCLILSVGVVLLHVLPKFLHLNIFVSNALLNLLNWIAQVVDGGLELCRRVAITSAENFARWLRSSGAGGEAAPPRDEL